MKIKIDSDVYDIVDRIKEIDDGYFILYDTNRKVFEVHNKNQFDSYCLTVVDGVLDSRVIDLLYKSNIVFIDNIVEDIDNTNEEIERKGKQKIKDDTDYRIREMYKFLNNSSKEIGEDLFKSKWR